MARCFCPCHTHPGTYAPPCGVCGHDTREGRMVGGYRDGWEPNESPCPLSLKFRDGVTCGAFRTGEGCHNHQVIAGLREHAVTADRLESQNRKYREALELISRGVWTARNSVESMVWTAREALKEPNNGR